MKSIFIDGHSGTTGLELQERLAGREDLELLLIDAELRKDATAKKQLAAQADLVVLCLPDEAAVEAVELYKDLGCKILDASTAHRTNPAWAYGLPELSPEQRGKISGAPLVANPGCYPTGFLLLVAPLVRAGLLPADYPVVVHAMSGYSGGGRQMIEDYEQEIDSSWAARIYGLDLKHKHKPEMFSHSGLSRAPIFVPQVADFRQGMLVQVALHRDLLGLKSPDALVEIGAIWEQAYGQERFIEPLEGPSLSALDGKFLAATALNGTNRVELMRFGQEDQILLCARLDNLGKGASGAAVQNLNLMLDLEESLGLD
ncbi:MAG: N-acetyl-gamma-glutamyl-phosphate reductase [bacterium]|nr:N-acetyl-gamma-glutamyl-phosphate reductase [bacterium]